MAYERYSVEALMLGCNIMVLKAYLVTEPPMLAEAIEGLDRAMEVLFHHSQNERAIKNFKRAIEIAPEVPLPYINLARVYIDTQRYEDAIKTCQRALIVGSDYAKIYYMLGLAHLAAGDRKSAIRDHRVLLTLNRDLAKKLYEAINK